MKTETELLGELTNLGTIRKEIKRLEDAVDDIKLPYVIRAQKILSDRHLHECKNFRLSDDQTTVIFDAVYSYPGENCDNVIETSLPVSFFTEESSGYARNRYLAWKKELEWNEKKRLDREAAEEKQRKVTWAEYERLCKIYESPRGR